MTEVREEDLLQEVAQFLYANSFESATNTKYTFNLVWKRLSSAENGDVEGHAAIPNLTVPEIFYCSVIEYFVSRNFAISFDNGVQWKEDGSEWRNAVPAHHMLTMFSFCARMFDQVFEVGCSIFRTNAIVALTHIETGKLFSAHVATLELEKLKTNLGLDEYLAGSNRYCCMAINLDKKFQFVFTAAHENQPPPSMTMSPIVVANE